MKELAGNVVFGNVESQYSAYNSPTGYVLQIIEGEKTKLYYRANGSNTFQQRRIGNNLIFKDLLSGSIYRLMSGGNVIRSNVESSFSQSSSCNTCYDGAGASGGASTNFLSLLSTEEEIINSCDGPKIIDYLFTCLEDPTTITSDVTDQLITWGPNSSFGVLSTCTDLVTPIVSSTTDLIEGFTLSLNNNAQPLIILQMNLFISISSTITTPYSITIKASLCKDSSVTPNTTSCTLVECTESFPSTTSFFIYPVNMIIKGVEDTNIINNYFSVYISTLNLPSGTTIQIKNRSLLFYSSPSLSYIIPYS